MRISALCSLNLGMALGTLAARAEGLPGEERTDADGFLLPAEALARVGSAPTKHATCSTSSPAG